MENKNELIVLEQLPIIKTHLKNLSVEIKQKVEQANSLVCTEDTVKDVKKVRADLNKEFTELETQRKLVKSKIMEKYDEFEEIYKENVSNLYKNADIDLKQKIDNVENQLREEKYQEVLDFYNEQVESYGLNDFVEFNDIGLKINLSSSLKSLQTQVMEHCEKVAKDIKLINLEEFKDEILVEYKLCKDYIVAKTKVLDRHLQLEELAKKQQEQEVIKEQEKKIIEQVENIVAPVEIDEEIIEITFTIRCSREKAKGVKTYFISEGIEYK